jgi:hypothetical protein
MKRTILKTESSKQELINRLSDDGNKLLVFFDDLADAPSTVNVVEEGVAIVSPPYDYESLERWWYYGNWQAVSPVNQEYIPFDTFKSTDQNIECALQDNQLSIIIDCFHDDVEWNVAEKI